jgi:L-amino acid N-acyltransferase YncA
MTFVTRPMRSDDVAALCDVLNRIIAAGGTTALEVPMDADTFRDRFIDGQHVLLSTVVLHGARRLGFQSISGYASLPVGWGDIATFTDRRDPVRGAGQALFATTCAAARARGLAVLNATIRADNSGGLRFYRALGFRAYDTSAGVPLADGTPVDRLHHRFDL